MPSSGGQVSTEYNISYPMPAGRGRYSVPTFQRVAVGMGLCRAERQHSRQRSGSVLELHDG